MLRLNYQKLQQLTIINCPLYGGIPTNHIQSRVTLSRDSALRRSIMMKKTILFIVLSTLAITSFALKDSGDDNINLSTHEFTPLSPERKHREASIHVARSLLINHYRKQDIDRELSSKAFDAYLDTLDGQRLYLLQSDIDEFEPYRYRLDGALKTGQLEPGFRIYNRFQERFIARLRAQLKFVEHDLNSLDFSKHEFILTDRKDAPWATSQEELDDIWRRRIKSAVLSNTLNGKTLEETQETLKKRYENQLKRTLQARNEDAFQAYMNAFTHVYDPHTTYFSPRTSENFNINMSLSLEGIGAVLQSDNEYTKVVRLVTGGPADKQGQLQAADRIVGVGQDKNGEIINVVGWRLDEVVALIRGPKHSVVRLEVIPSESKVDTDTKVINIVRDKVKLEDQAASSHTLEIERNGKTNRIGIIEIPTFYADFQAMQEGDKNYKSTTRDTVRLLNELKAEGELDGLVIDLRGNGGGSLDEANKLTGLFIDEGPTVQIRNTNNRVEIMEDPDPAQVYDGPLIVLVDRFSASASEIFAGAIQDYGRGIIMGSPTFGKGTVQSVRPLNHGQLKITQAKFYRISGASTQHKGVIPDIIIPDTVDRTKVGEDALDNALPWDSIKPAPFRHLNLVNENSQKLASLHKERFEHHPEYKLLLEEISLLEAQRAKDRVSLNKKQRKAENESLDKAQLAIINKRRELNGKAPFKTVEEWDDDEEAKASKKEDKEPDFVAKESAQVLLDYIDLSHHLTAQAEVSAVH